MAKKTPKVHPHNPAVRNPQFAKAVFDNARRPLLWLYVGRELRSSANVILRHEEPIATKHWNEFHCRNFSEIRTRHIKQCSLCFCMFS